MFSRQTRNSSNQVSITLSTLDKLKTINFHMNFKLYSKHTLKIKIGTFCFKASLQNWRVSKPPWTQILIMGILLTLHGSSDFNDSFISSASSLDLNNISLSSSPSLLLSIKMKCEWFDSRIMSFGLFFSWIP